MLSNSVRFLVSPLSTHSFPLLSLFRFGILILVPNFLKIRPILAKERKRERERTCVSRGLREQKTIGSAKETAYARHRVTSPTFKFQPSSCVQLCRSAFLPFRATFAPPPPPLLATVCRATREECKRIHSTRELFFPRPNSTPIFNHPLYRDHFCPREESTLRG